MILIVSDTPVAGTVKRFFDALKKHLKEEVFCLIKKNYRQNPFSLDGILAYGSYKDWKTFLAKQAKDSRKIFIHNVCDYETIEIIMNNSNANDVAYHLHSPPLEPPHYGYDILNAFSFQTLYVVAQGHGRFIENAIEIPNIIPDIINLSPPNRNNIIFMPHLRSTKFRWSSKIKDSDQIFFEESATKIHPFNFKTINDVFNREVVAHSELLSYLQTVDAVVDDINTGLFHQLSLEGLKSGAAVFNSADYDSVFRFCGAIEAPEPPFVHINNNTDLIDYFIDQGIKEKLIEAQALSKKYADLYLPRERLELIYINKTHQFLNG